jgi:hypothetical protein
MIRNEFPYQKWMKLFDGIRSEYQRCYRRAGVTLTPNLGLRAYRPGVNSMPDDVASHSTRQVITTLAGAGNGGANQSILFFSPLLSAQAPEQESDFWCWKLLGLLGNELVR